MNFCELSSSYFDQRFRGGYSDFRPPFRRHDVSAPFAAKRTKLSGGALSRVGGILNLASSDLTAQHGKSETVGHALLSVGAFRHGNLECGSALRP